MDPMLLFCTLCTLHFDWRWQIQVLVIPTNLGIAANFNIVIKNNPTNDKKSERLLYSPQYTLETNIP